MTLIQEHGVRARKLSTLRDEHKEALVLRSDFEKEEAIVRLEGRFNRGVGLFDGVPLQGGDADDWLRLQFGMVETTQELPEAA